MTVPQEPNQPLTGHSEYSHEGMFPHPDLDFQTGQPTLPIGQGSRDNYFQSMMARRTDTTDPTSVPDPYVLGNPDRYGGQPPLVKEKPGVVNGHPKVDPSRPLGVPGAPFKTGVTREG